MNILVAVDGSETSHAAVREVRDRPWPEGSTIRLLSVVQPAAIAPPVSLWGSHGPPIAPATGFARPEQRESVRAATEERLSRVAETLRGTGVPVEVCVKEGEARAAIVEEATTWPADLIVVGSRGLSGIKRLLLGSVAQSVVSHAPCSVEVVRARDADG